LTSQAAFGSMPTSTTIRVTDSNNQSASLEVDWNQYCA
jgi:hypothetical protein